MLAASGRTPIDSRHAHGAFGGNAGMQLALAVAVFSFMLLVLFPGP